MFVRGLLVQFDSLGLGGKLWKEREEKGCPHEFLTSPVALFFWEFQEKLEFFRVGHRAYYHLTNSAYPPQALDRLMVPRPSLSYLLTPTSLLLM